MDITHTKALKKDSASEEMKKLYEHFHEVLHGVSDDRRTLSFSVG
jgi:hypothetical protein